MALKRIAIGSFCLFHIVAITLWCLPIPTSLTGKFRDAVRPYMLWSGLFQNWNMFAPEPMKLNGYLEAEIVFRDGRTRTWTFPRMEKLGLIDRCFKERYRKFANEYVRFDKYAALWPDVARFIARANYQPANPPVVIVLNRYWSELKPPLPDGSPQAGPWMRYRFFLYAVKPGDLL